MSEHLPITTIRAIAQHEHLINQLHRTFWLYATAADIELQHSLLLVQLLGLPEGTDPTVGQITQRMKIKQNSVVSLIDRMEAAGLVYREKDTVDNRRVFVRLTEEGEHKASALILAHAESYITLGEGLRAGLMNVIDLTKE